MEAIIAKLEAAAVRDGSWFARFGGREGEDGGHDEPEEAQDVHLVERSRCTVVVVRWSWSARCVKLFVCVVRMEDIKSFRVGY